MKQHLSLFNYSVHNQANDTLDVNVDGYIVDAPTQEVLKAFWGDETSVSFKSVRDQIKASNPKTINFTVNSGGGHVGDAMAIHDLIVEMKGKGVTVNTKGTGIVASAATFIVMAGGENSSMTENSWFMVHNAGGAIVGDVNVVENYARVLRKFNDNITSFYAKATGLSNKALSDMMNEETWMTAAEAKEKGFIKNITGQENFTNKIKAEQWPFENMAVLNTYNSFVKEPTATEDHTKSFFEKLNTQFMNFLNKLTGSVEAAKTDKKFENVAEREAILNMVVEVLKPVMESIDEKIKNETDPNPAPTPTPDPAPATPAPTPTPTPTPEPAANTSEDAQAEIERLKIENKKLKAAAASKATKPEEDAAVNAKKYSGVRISYAKDEDDTSVDDE